jgi:hypothetical protein
VWQLLAQDECDGRAPEKAAEQETGTDGHQIDAEIAGIDNTPSPDQGGAATARQR